MNYQQKIKDEIVEKAEDSNSRVVEAEKDKRIKKEIRRLRKLFPEVNENKQKLVFSVIDDMAFLAITMQDLRENIIKDGTTVEYKNGENQYGTKQNPDAQLYLQMSQKHSQAAKILMDCFPKAEKPLKTNDGFEDFIYERGD